jgi:hydantoinase/carbamoylase family amidase
VSAQGTGARERTLAGDLVDAARFGARPEGGISRFAWSSELAEVSAWVAEELERLGLEPRTDAAGNLIARWPAGEGKAVMVASHLDTVPNGGAFDGVAGVLGAVEAIRILRQTGFEPARPIWVGAFMDEEGTRFGTALFGSRAFAGQDVSAALEVRDRDGISMREAIEASGLDPDRVHDAAAVGELAAYLELHVEQGPVLHQRSRRLGLVESITGVMGFHVTVSGDANHAGTTPTDVRRDALVGAARMILELRRETQRRPEIRATVGQIAAQPGAITVIPGRCRFSVDLRPSTADVFAPAREWLCAMVEAIAAEEGLSASIESDYELAPVPMATQVVEALERAALEQEVEPLRLWSGAGHDAMVIAPHVPTGMIFVPSRDGISHSPHEWTETADCELGARVLAGALRRLAS